MKVVAIAIVCAIGSVVILFMAVSLIPGPETTTRQSGFPNCPGALIVSDTTNSGYDCAQ